MIALQNRAKNGRAANVVSEEHSDIPHSELSDVDTSDLPDIDSDDDSMIDVAKNTLRYLYPHYFLCQSVTASIDFHDGYLSVIDPCMYHPAKRAGGCGALRMVKDVLMCLERSKSLDVPWK